MSWCLSTRLHHVLACFSDLWEKQKIGKYVQIQNADKASLAGKQLAEPAAEDTEL
jgi:hypothetical protein